MNEGDSPNSQNESDLVAGRGISRRKRRAIKAIAIFIAMVCLGGLVWEVGVPRYRPSLRAGEQYGLDVSHHQGEIDWKAVRSDGITFSYLKATEGGDHTDRMFERNAAQAQAAGLRVGAYHFFTFCRPGRDQATHFLKVSPPRTDWLPPAIDIEYAGNCSRRPTRVELEAEVNEFVKMVEAAWGRPLIAYVLNDTEDDYGIAKTLGRSRWNRSLFRRPGGTDWVVWQVSFLAKVEGVKGGVDLNVARPSFLAG